MNEALQNALYLGIDICLFLAAVMFLLSYCHSLSQGYEQLYGLVENPYVSEYLDPDDD